MNPRTSRGFGVQVEELLVSDAEVTLWNANAIQSWNNFSYSYFLFIYFFVPVHLSRIRKALVRFLMEQYIGMAIFL